MKKTFAMEIRRLLFDYRAAKPPRNAAAHHAWAAAEAQRLAAVAYQVEQLFDGRARPAPTETDEFLFAVGRRRKRRAR